MDTLMGNSYVFHAPVVASEMACDSILMWSEYDYLHILYS